MSCPCPFPMLSIACFYRTTSQTLPCQAPPDVTLPGMLNRCSMGPRHDAHLASSPNSGERRESEIGPFVFLSRSLAFLDHRQGITRLLGVKAQSRSKPRGETEAVYTRFIGSIRSATKQTDASGSFHQSATTAIGPPAAVLYRTYVARSRPPYITVYRSSYIPRGQAQAQGGGKAKRGVAGDGCFAVNC
ncbi:hypothetical protein B0J15DRAFT_278016 [Fusarium solani]|uniref:Uncharacterized protein n=1 Tax=Fusarium solani TaxID=169388 RepID=A0A9P9KK71_FUSSL|nr:uncharacterized protein B0J15DRAFT_278016 [Fusarium solani]KAH7260096.1 hypothetical protein B0J15DRAFT_278016 [Fusarium solani]